MKHALALLVLLGSITAFADARLELDTGTVHAPYDQADADQEYKLTDGASSIFSTQNANGTYDAFYRSKVLAIPEALIRGFDLGEVQTTGKQAITTDCVTTAATFQDDDGNQYESNHCTVRLTVNQTSFPNRYDLQVDVTLRLLAPVVSELQAESAGMSLLYRE